MKIRVSENCEKAGYLSIKYFDASGERVRFSVGFEVDPNDDEKRAKVLAMNGAECEMVVIGVPKS